MLLSFGSTLLNIWNTAWPIIVAILLFAIIIIIHELGHFSFAKWFKVKVNEFAVGFGPTIFKRKKGDTTYAWRLIPFGGFCSMEGEDEDSDDQNAFGKKSVWKRIIIVAAGGINNIILGLILITIMLGIDGSFMTTTVKGFYLPLGDINADGYVSSADADMLSRYLDESIEFNDQQLKYADINSDGKLDKVDYDAILVASKDEKANKPLSFSTGLKTNDEILKVNGRSVYCASDLSYMMMSSTDTKVDLLVNRNGEKIELNDVEFKKSEIDGNSYISVDFTVESVDISLKHPVTYLKCAFKETMSNARVVWMTLFDMITGRYGLNDIMGPVGVVSTVSNTVSQAASSPQPLIGVSTILYLMGIITINLGIVNLLPLPALDGGRLLILLFEGITRKKVPAKVEGVIHGVGFALLMVLILVITGNDIIRLIKG